MLQKIDQAITKLIDKAYKQAQAVLEDNLDILHKLAELLLEKETVLGRELDQLIESLRPGIDLASGTDKDSKKKSQKESEAAPQPETDPGAKSTAGPEPDQSAA